MLGYVLKRIITLIATLWIIITITFFAMKALPGDPFSDDMKMPPIVKSALRSKYGLDKPINEQYFIYIKNILKGDLGISMKYENVSVKQIIAEGFPVSAALGLVAAVFGITLGIAGGAIAGLNRQKFIDYFISVISVLGICVPGFVIASLLQITLGGKLLPVARWGTPKHIVLPALALGIGIIAYQARMMRTSVVEVLRQDYIKTSKAMGLSFGETVRTHVLRNSLLPNITVIGPLIAGLMCGTFVIEKIFAIPGLGKYYIQSIQQSDYTVIMGMTIFYASMLLVMTFIVDVLYGIVDPRIKIYKSDK